MTEEKICPIMSKPFVAIAANQLPYSVGINFKNDLCYTVCLEEKCMAWEKPCKDKDDCEYCEHREYNDNNQNICQGQEGYCKLIERQP